MKCVKGSGGQHKFEARFTEKDRGVHYKHDGYMTAEEIRKIITLNVYVHDICVWCGKTVRGATE